MFRINSLYGCFFLLSICFPCFIFGEEVDVTPDSGQFIKSGQFQRAIPLLSEQVKAYAGNGDTEKEILTLVKLAEAQQAIGEYSDAEQHLLSALSLSEEPLYKGFLPQIYAALGNLYIAFGESEKAERYIQQAIELLNDEPNSLLSKAVMLNNLGNAYVSSEKEQKAILAYEESTQLAGKMGSYLLQAKSSANIARLKQQQNKPAEADELINKAMSLLENINHSHDKCYLLINLARTDYYLADKQATARSHQLFSQADQLASQLKDHRAGSYALGYLGELYEQNKRYHEAIALTQQAIFQAQQLGNEDARQLLFLWYWQRGRLYEALRDRKEAIKAYQLAVEQVQELRYQMQVAYQNNRSSFEEVMQPVYLRLVDLLLQEAEQSGESANAPKILFKARNTVEQLKAAELRDYFHDQCVDALQAKVKDVGQVSQTALVIYPVVLDDRMELLITLPSGAMKRYTSHVDKITLEKTAREFRNFLESKFTYEFRGPAKKLYQWLVAPYQSELLSEDIDTLVFVPDGELRTIPMAALYDDGEFLIERYAVAITPSIKLTDPRPIDNAKVNALFGGITESVHGFPALVNVKDEIESVQKLYGGKILMNADFKRVDLKDNLNDTGLNVFHIATHAQFEGDANKSFILTYDGRLSINDLADYIGLFKFRETPLDLLVLSACETARGDRRSALGLSGVAIKAGARSALGALWQVDDKASSVLMKRFYQQLYNPDNSRAAALKLAQQQMIKEKSYQHPRFWSSYILINSWL